MHTCFVRVNRDCHVGDGTRGTTGQTQHRRGFQVSRAGPADKTGGTALSRCPGAVAGRGPAQSGASIGPVPRSRRSRTPSTGSSFLVFRFENVEFDRIKTEPICHLRDPVLACESGLVVAEQQAAAGQFAQYRIDVNTLDGFPESLWGEQIKIPLPVDVARQVARRPGRKALLVFVITILTRLPSGLKVTGNQARPSFSAARRFFCSGSAESRA